jgi:hypothetical protein
LQILYGIDNACGLVRGAVNPRRACGVEKIGTQEARVLGCRSEVPW